MTIDTLAERIRCLPQQQLRAFRDAIASLGNEQDARLVAYLQAKPEKQLDTQAIRKWLSGQLPDYMIPSQFQQLVALPRLANGKIDRERLPQHAPVGPRSKEADEPESADDPAKKDDLESRLAAVWARNLKTDYVLPDDDFFELGGHSLLGVQLLLDVREEFGTEIPLADLFEASRLRDMVSRIRSADATPRVVATIQRGKNQTPIFSVHGGDKTFAAAFGPDRPLYLVFDSISTTSADMSSVEAIAEYYLQGVRTIQPHGPYFLCGFSLGGMIAYEMAIRLTQAGELVELVGLFDSTPPHIGRWGLGLRAYKLVARLGDREGVWSKVSHLLSNIAGVTRRRLHAMTRKPIATPRDLEQIRDSNVARYYKIGFRYRYPVSRLDCVVYMPEWHPLWVRHLHRKWRRVIDGSLTVECVEGAREHADITRPPFDARSATSFAAHVSAVETGVSVAGDRQR